MAGRRGSTRSRRVVRSCALMVVAFLVAALLAALPTAPASAAPKAMVTGWLPYWTTSASLASYTRNADLFTDVSPFWHDTEVGGSPGSVAIIDHAIGQSKASAMATLRAAGKKVVPSVTDGTPGGWMAAVLANPSTRTAHVEQLVALAQRNGYDGLDLDYEKFAFTDARGTWTNTKPNWSAFVTELATRFHQSGLILTAALPTSDYWVYDFPTMGRVLDRVRIMTYDYSWSTPGPVSPIWWFEAQTKAMLAMIPGQKLMMGVPTYGRDWVRRNPDNSYAITDAQGRPTTTAACPASYSVATRAPDAVNNSAIFNAPGAEVTRSEADDETRVRYVQTYTDGVKTCNISREAWLSDAASAAHRLQVAVDLGAAGAAFWTVGGEDPAQWAPLRAIAQSKAPSLVPMGATVRVHTGSPDATVIGNLTVTDTQQSGYLTAWPCDQPRPVTSVANFTAGPTVPAFTTVRTDARGDFCVYTTAWSHLIWDQTATTSLSLPERRMDTRSFGAPVRGGSIVRVDTGVPNSSVVGTLTVTAPEAAGFTSAWPCLEPQPYISVNNFTAGQTTSNFTAVRSDANGNVCLYTTATAHLLWDQQRGTPALDLPAPQVVVDTRSGDPLASGGTLRIPTGHPGTTVLGNLTAIGPGADGYLTVWNCSDTRPTASALNYVAGEVVPSFVAARADANGDICVYSTAATHLLLTSLGTSAALVAETPQRLFDAPVTSGSVVRIQTGARGESITGNLTADAGGSSGYATLYPCDRGRPATSNVNIRPGEKTSNMAMVRSDDNGEICLFVAGTARLIWDQIGHTAPLAAQTPNRIIDTRAGVKPDAGAVLRVATGKANTVVFGNVTVTEPAYGAFTTVWPCASDRPVASVNNYLPGQTTSNFTAVATDAKGEFCLYTKAPAHLLWDQSGQTAAFAPSLPQRLIDTRAGSKPGAGAVTVVHTASPATTVLGNLTVTDTEWSGFTTAWPCDQPRPNASVNNYEGFETRPNFAAVRTDPNGDFCVYTKAPAHVLWDQIAVAGTIGAHVPARLLDTRVATP